MRTFQAISLLLLLVLVPGCATLASTDLLPGLTYYDSSEKLTGKLVFLLRHDYNQETNSETAASIYEFDLSQRKLRKLTESPNGLSLASDRGNVFCVVYRPGDWFRSNDTNAFVYSDSMRQSRIVTLDNPPKKTVIADEHVFFEMENTNGGTTLLDYDIASDQKRPTEVSDVRWQNQSHANHTYKAFDGSYIFFLGPDAPAIGLKLVSSPWSDFETKFQDPKGKKVKGLKTFSRMSALGGGIYLLSQMSPDGRYALVRLQEPTSRKSGMLPGFVNTYYLVDASNGKTQVLLKDEIERKTDSSMPIVRWVGGVQ